MVGQYRLAQSSPAPKGWVSQYILGLVVVIFCFVGGMIVTDHTLGQLAGDLRAANVASCTGAGSPGCRADYPATVTSVHSDTNLLVLSTSFRADTARADECFGSDCSDTVGLRRSGLNELRVGQRVRINAAKGRIYTIAANGSILPTYDYPGVSALDHTADFIAAVYLDAFAIAWLLAYVFLTLRYRVWRVVSTTVRRSLRVAAAIAVVGSVVSFVAFGLGGPQSLILLATGLLILGGAGLLSRRHPEARQSAGFTANIQWRPAYNRAGADAIYVLCALPMVLFVNVALRLAHDDGMIIGPVIAGLIGIAITALIEWRVHRSLHRAPRRRMAATSPL